MYLPLSVPMFLVFLRVGATSEALTNVVDKFLDCTRKVENIGLSITTDDFCVIVTGIGRSNLFRFIGQR